jgi:hypothetical protein
MSIFLDTRGNSSLGVGICDRCRRKLPINNLQPDRNTPGLMVCDDGCNDDFDPWRLPARQSESLTLPHYRPDVPIGVQPTLEGYDGEFRITEEDDFRITQGNPLDGDDEEGDYRITEVFP